MITLLALKRFLSRAWTWLKHNWYVPAVLIYTIVLWVLFRKKDKAREVLEVRAKSYEEQIDVIEKSYEEEIKKRDMILETYEGAIRELEKKYESCRII